MLCMLGHTSLPGSDHLGASLVNPVRWTFLAMTLTGFSAGRVATCEGDSTKEKGRGKKTGRRMRKWLLAGKNQIQPAATIFFLEKSNAGGTGGGAARATYFNHNVGIEDIGREENPEDIVD